MKRIILAISSAFIALSSYAQITFEEIYPTTSHNQMFGEFEPVYYGSVDYADVDGDGDEDVFITGFDTTYTRIAKLYKNDGNGAFLEVSGTPFIPVCYSSCAFSDVDNDGDFDLVVNGEAAAGGIRVAKLYLNDGLGNFALIVGSSLNGTGSGKIQFADIDGDGDDDLMFTGIANASTTQVAKLYKNNGSGVFTESFSFTGGLNHGDFDFGDVDGDGDMDLVMTGSFNSNQLDVQIYLNDGSGNYNILSGTSFTPVWFSRVKWFDADGDGDLDLFYSGKTGSITVGSFLYLNNGSAVFTLQATSIEPLHSGDISSSDLNGDGNIDILISGHEYSSTSSNGPIKSYVYLNDGSAGFSSTVSDELIGIAGGEHVFVDVDGDSDKDLVIVGHESAQNSHNSKLYVNDGNGHFSLITGRPRGVTIGSSIFSDADNDGDLDLFISGHALSGRSSEMYLNDGTGSFEISDNSFIGLFRSGNAVGDVTGNGFNDFIISGQDQSNQVVTKLYNNQSGEFNVNNSISYDEITFGTTDLIDVDGDNDLDLMVTGIKSNGLKIAKLYLNDGLGNYSLKVNPFEGVRLSAVKFADIDGDLDLDVIITGYNSSNVASTKLYENDGNGNFVLLTASSIENVYNASVDMADIDGDNDLDLFICGTNASNVIVSNLYLNDGAGVFTHTSSSIEGTREGECQFVDLDSDGFPEIFVSGRNQSFQRVAKLYKNNGAGVFSEVLNSYFDGVSNSSLDFGDIDGDSDMDLIITGTNNSNIYIAKLYRNTTCVPNTGTDMQIACDSYSWIDGNTYTIDNTSATHTLQNQFGCDSVVTLNLTINHSTTGIDTQVACDSYQWIDGNTYTSNNTTATHTLTNSINCDSVVTLNLTIKNSSSGVDVQTACNSYVWIDGNTYTASNTSATHTLTNSIGCDSVVTLNLTINNSTTGIDTQIACNTFDWIDGSTYTSSNNSATHTLQNQFGCDSVVTLNLIINNDNTGIDTQVGCNTYTWIDGNTYSSNNNSATHTLQNQFGCDSVVTLNLTINSSNTGIDTQVACDSYLWIDGNIYTSNNFSATHTLTNMVGCDSVVTLNLTINNSSTGIDAQSACESYVWIDGNTYTTSNTSATYTLQNQFGCDSIVTLNLTINQSTTGIDTQIACDSYDWIDGITYTSNNNSAMHTLTNMLGCDSVVTLNLTIKNSTSGIDIHEACESFVWIDGNTYSSSNNQATHTFINADGCDSIVTLNLTIFDILGTDVQNSCDSLIWIDGNTYYEDNNSATHTLLNGLGCDSVVTLNLTVTILNTIVTVSDPLLSAEESIADYQWIDCGTDQSIADATSQNFTPTYNGEFAVEITRDGCLDTSACYAVSTIGIEEKENRFSLFPNPSNGEVFIMSNGNSNFAVNIYDASGKIVFSAHELSHSNKKIDFRFSSGLYLIEIISDNKIEKYKLVVN